MDEQHVSERARVMAADLFAVMGGTATGCTMIREGEADAAPVAQAFARFEAQVRREVIEECAQASSTPLPAAVMTSEYIAGWCDAQEDSAFAIRALNPDAPSGESGEGEDG